MHPQRTLHSAPSCRLWRKAVISDVGTWGSSSTPPQMQGYELSKKKEERRQHPPKREAHAFQQKQSDHSQETDIAIYFPSIQQPVNPLDFGAPEVTVSWGKAPLASP